MHVTNDCKISFEPSVVDNYFLSFFMNCFKTYFICSTALKSSILSHFTELLVMSFSLSLHFLLVLSLETSVCSTLKFILFSGVIMSIRSSFLLSVDSMVREMPSNVWKNNVDCFFPKYRHING